MADDETTDDPDEDTSSLGGKITEKLGWLTADRQMEAEGRLNQTEDDGLSGDDDDAARAADAAQLEVRRDYDELHPDIEPD
ncbi:MAG: hypothetical protein WKF43_03670 [Acidimicrobiales bacterium]